MRTPKEIEEQAKQEYLNQELANNLLVKNPELAKFIQSRINYLISLNKIPTNEFETVKAYHKRSALEELLNDLVTLNAKYITNQAKPIEQQKQKIVIK